MVGKSSTLSTILQQIKNGEGPKSLRAADSLLQSVHENRTPFNEALFQEIRFILTETGPLLCSGDDRSSTRGRRSAPGPIQSPGAAERASIGGPASQSVRENSLPAPMPTALDQNSGSENLASVVQELLGKLAPNKTDIDRINSCLAEITVVSKEIGPNWKARAFGSIASKVGTFLSDLDVTCYMEAGLEANGTAETALRQFLQVLEQRPSFEIIDVILNARIPIVKMRFDGKLEVDLSFQNTAPFRNTQLLRAYASLSTSVRELVTLIKLWAKFEGVCGAPERHLSSYSFTLMVIYFLQVDPQVKMPVFPTADFTGDQELPECARSWQCPLTLPVLIVRFFEFYVTEYRWGQEVVSVRNGQRIDASDVRNDQRVYVQLRSSKNSSMPHIEDPILLDKNLNYVLGLQQNTVLRNKLCSALGQIQRDRAPAGFITALSHCHSMMTPKLQQIRGGGTATPVELVKDIQDITAVTTDAIEDVAIRKTCSLRNMRMTRAQVGECIVCLNPDTAPSAAAPAPNLSH